MDRTFIDTAQTGIQTAQAGLTTTESPFIELARREGQLYIDQPYELYSEENHEAWRRLYSRMGPRWQRYANEHFLAGMDALRLDPNRVPRLADVNRFLGSLTGFEAKAVSGYVPAFVFFAACSLVVGLCFTLIPIETHGKPLQIDVAREAVKRGAAA